MKKLLICVVFVLSGFFLSRSVAQYALVFNQVKLVGTTLETVPAGTVWKVESVMSASTLVPPTGTSDNSYYSISKIIEINGNQVVISRASRYTENNGRYNSESTTDISMGTVSELPMWLPAGTTLRAGTNALFINVIEFNLATP